MKKSNFRDPYFIVISVILVLLGGGVAFFIKDWVKVVLLLPIIDALWWLYSMIDSLPQLFLWFFFLGLGILFVLMNLIRSFAEALDAINSGKKTTSSSYLLDLTHLRNVDPSNPYTQQRLARHLVEMYFEALGIQPLHAHQMQEDLQQKFNQLPREVFEVFQFGLQGNRRFYLADARWYLVKHWTFYMNVVWHLMLQIFRLQNRNTDQSLNHHTPYTGESYLPLENEFPPQDYFEKTLFFIEQQLFMHRNN